MTEFFEVEEKLKALKPRELPVKLMQSISTMQVSLEKNNIRSYNLFFIKTAAVLLLAFVFMWQKYEKQQFQNITLVNYQKNYHFENTDKVIEEWSKKRIYLISLIETKRSVSLKRVSFRTFYFINK